MFGPFKPSNVLFGGLLWKIPWRMSQNQKYRQRRRLRAVDNVIATVDQALKAKGMTTKYLERMKAEVPRESEMLPKDKYTMFTRKMKGYRIGLHRVDKWTRRTLRVNPKGF
ncbi:mitochondrial ribosomal protein-like protein subunit L31 [Myxozyma melibiosi]|uniref:Large ribosomal subunit protein mL60 n=1 Tax=Myxozyma melibiosi TaxID=54550 RepID=A0ABR1F6L4_9ASCO